MDMGAAAGALKEATNEDFVFHKDFSADRAYPIPISD
jgi:hypothetical protein